MKSNFEVTGIKNGKKMIVYYTSTLYNGVANDIYNVFKRIGWKKINIHLI